MSSFGDKFSESRLKVQGVLMGFGTSDTEVMKASVFKAIKSVDNGGPKEKHFAFSMKMLQEDSQKRLQDILVTLCAINFYKDSVRAIRIVLFVIRMFGSGVALSSGIPDEVHDLVQSLLTQIRYYWCEEHVGSGGPPVPGMNYMRWEDSDLRDRFIKLISYASAKVNLLRAYPVLGSHFFINNESKDASTTTAELRIPIVPERIQISVLSVCLNCMQALLSAIPDMSSEMVNFDQRERQCFRAAVPALLADLARLLILNTHFLKIIRISAQSNRSQVSVFNALVGQYNAQHSKMREMTILVRGKPTQVLSDLSLDSGFREIPDSSQPSFASPAPALIETTFANFDNKASSTESIGGVVDNLLDF